MITASTFAINFDLKENVIINSDEIVKGDFFVEGNKVVNRGTVRGDMVVISNSLENQGLINGDLLSFSITNQVSGTVKGDIRALSRNFFIDGEIYRNITVYAKKFILSKDGTVDGSITGIGDYIQIDGLIGSSLRGSIRTLVINGKVKGNVNVTVDHIIIGPNAEIEGDFKYKSKEMLDIPKGRVRGEIEFLEKHSIFDKKTIKFLGFAKNIVDFLGLFIILIILSLIFPKKINKMIKYIELKHWKEIAIGSLFIILIPIISFISFLTLVGFPVGMIIFTLYIILLYLAKMPISIWLGGLMIKGESRLILKGGLGLFIITIVTLIPYIGRYIEGLVIILGFGVYYPFLKEIVFKYRKV